jgi:hypothetical protein
VAVDELRLIRDGVGRDSQITFQRKQCPGVLFDCRKFDHSSVMSTEWKCQGLKVIGGCAYLHRMTCGAAEQGGRLVMMLTEF